MLLVFDEIQTGMGRTGRMFASEHWGVDGDIVCLAKGIANGLPLGAIVARAAVMDWPSGSHASTFGGNPVACAAALATLSLDRKSLSGQRRAPRARTQEGLRGLAERLLASSEVRGLGLMVGHGSRRPTAVPTRPAAIGSSTWPSIEDSALALRAEHDPVLSPVVPDARQVEIGLDLLAATMAAAEVEFKLRAGLERARRRPPPLEEPGVCEIEPA